MQPGSAYGQDRGTNECTLNIYDGTAKVKIGERHMWKDDNTEGCRTRGRQPLPNHAYSSLREFGPTLAAEGIVFIRFAAVRTYTRLRLFCPAFHAKVLGLSTDGATGGALPTARFFPDGELGMLFKIQNAIRAYAEDQKQPCTDADMDRGHFAEGS